tara:strand:+ start:17624 stop:17872 length:249 start_codon:yes stop_codon:yes gene_type:complete
MDLKSKKVKIKIDVLEAMHILSVLKIVSEGLAEKPRNFENYLFKQALNNYEKQLEGSLNEEKAEYAADSFDIREMMYKLENE